MVRQLKPVGLKSAVCQTVSLPDFHRVATRDYDCVDLIEEKAVLHHAGNSADRRRDLGQSWYLAESRV